MSTDIESIDLTTRLLIQHQGFVNAARRRAEIKASIAEREQRYGIRSEDLHALIDRGELEETLEVCHWLIEYHLICRVEAE